MHFMQRKRTKKTNRDNYQVEHGFRHPRGREQLSMVSDPLLGLDLVHELARYG